MDNSMAEYPPDIASRKNKKIKNKKSDLVYSQRGLFIDKEVKENVIF